MSKPKKNIYLIPISILVAGILIAGAILYSNNSGSLNKPATTAVENNNIPSQPTFPSQPKRADVNIKNVNIKGEPFIGKENAPVVLAYWFDFQCPFCKRFETNTLPVLVDKYVKTGKLKIVFKDFQFLGPDSIIAAMAEKAIWELYPGKYFQWHQAMYKAQDGENSGFGNKADIIKLTRTIPGINADKISQLMDKNKAEYQKEQDTDKAEGARFGINGTPGFIIGTQVISGAQPTDVFTQIIDAELNKVK